MVACKNIESPASHFLTWWMCYLGRKLNISNWENGSSITFMDRIQFDSLLCHIMTKKHWIELNVIDRYARLTTNILITHRRQTGTSKQTDRQALPNVLPPKFAVNKNDTGDIFPIWNTQPCILLLNISCIRLMFLILCMLQIIHTWDGKLKLLFCAFLKGYGASVKRLSVQGLRDGYYNYWQRLYS